MQQHHHKAKFTAILGSSLVATIIGLSSSTAFAQQATTSALTVRSTGTISGTLVLPKFNPNYNRVITRVDTDENGAFYRNEGTKNNPNLVKVYESNQVNIRTLDDGSMRYYVNFKGIPVTSFDAVINSPAFTDGEMTTFRYDGRADMEGVKIKAVVQDEFGVKKAYYNGTITDPKTGIQYEGKFQIKAQGPRYSDRNGGDSPNVFDYKSDLPGSPRAEPFKIKDNSPLVRLEIKVPEGTPIVTPTTGGTTPPTTGGTTPPTTGGTTPPTTGGSTPPNTGGNTPPTTGGSTPPTTGGNTPPTTGGSTPPTTGSTTPPSTGGSTPPPTTGSTTPPTIPSTNLDPSSSPITSTPSSPSSPSTPSTPSLSSTPSTPSTLTPSSPSPDISNIEFSSGNSFVSNSVVENPSDFNKTACSQDSVCETKTSLPKQRGPRSRVMMR